MRRLLGPAMLLCPAVLAPFAAAATIPTLPTVTTPTVSLPAPTLPTVTTPTVSTPVVTTPTVTTPPVTTPIATVPGVTVGTPAPAPTPRPPASKPPLASPGPAPTPQAATATPAQAPGGGASPLSPAAGQTGSPSVRPAAQAARPRGAGPTAARFHLARRGRVRVTVWQERPRCRLFGRYTVAGTPGDNALRLPRRVSGHTLAAGTYRLVGVSGRRTVLDLRVRVTRRHGRLRVRHTTLASTCLQKPEQTILFAAGPLPSMPTALSGTSGASHTGGASPAGGSRAAAGPPDAPYAPPRIVLRVEHAVRQTLLYVLLAVAIALFGGAALPGASSSGAAAALARHRAALTSAGLALIAAAVLALFLR